MKTIEAVSINVEDREWRIAAFEVFESFSGKAKGKTGFLFHEQVGSFDLVDQSKKSPHRQSLNRIGD